MRCEGNVYGFTDENVMGEISETFNREMYAQMAKDAREEGFELTDEELEGISGGWNTCWTDFDPYD